MAREDLPESIWRKKFDQLQIESRRKLKHARRAIIGLMQHVDRDLLPADLLKEVDRQITANEQAKKGLAEDDDLS